MKIMFAVGSYWPSQDGVASITEYLAEGLASRGHEVLVLTSAGDGGRQMLPREEVHEDVLIKRMRIYVEWPLKLQGRDIESTKQRYISEIKTFNPNILVVVCAQTWTFDWIMDDLDSIKCRKVFYSHGFSGMKKHYDYWGYIKHRNIVGVYREYLAQKYYYRINKYLRKYDMTLHITEWSDSYVYCEKNNIECKVLENAIEDKFFDIEMTHNYNSNRDGVVFLCIGNYNPNKNQAMIIEAFSKAQVTGCELWFAGFEENEYLDTLRELANKCGKDRKIVFNVHLSRDEIYDLYKNADVYVCASVSETWSIVAHEAAATGMPIISTPVGALKYMDGVLMANNEDELASQMEFLFFNQEKISENGARLETYVRKRKCQVSDKIDWIEKMFESLLK